MLDQAKNTGTPRRYLRNPNIRWFEIDISDLKEVLVEDEDVHRYELRSGDVLICEGGEAGRAALWAIDNSDIIFQKACHRVRVGPKLDARYFIHCLQHDYFSGRLEEYYTGATIKHLTGQDLARYEFPLPPLDEQRRIAAILDKADALRRKRKRALDLIEHLATATFRNAFGDVSRWNDVRPLAELAEVSSGITKGRKLNDKPTRSVPYMAVSNVQDKRIDLSVIKTIEATEEEIARYRLEKDDLLLTEGGDPDKLGRGSLWKDDIPEAIHQNHIFRVRIQSSDLIPTYLNWLVGSPYGKAYFMRSAKQTTGIASINKQQLSALPVPVPSLVSQHAFAHALSGLRDVSEKAIRSGAEISTLFASLQYRAFSG